MTRRRFIADTWDRDQHTAALTGDQAAHLARVLRAEPGQLYDLVAGGFLHRAEITAVTPDRVSFILHEELETDSALPLHLLLAIFKFDHFEWAIEKATELGVDRITPILARRTEKHLALSSVKRADRWRRIALEASKQSRRSSIPEIADPSPLPAALTLEDAPTRILLSELEQATPLQSALSSATRPVALAVGPEGGWAPDELQLFTRHTWQPVTLGPRILRAETAAIAAIAIAGANLH